MFRDPLGDGVGWTVTPHMFTISMVGLECMVSTCFSCSQVLIDVFVAGCVCWNKGDGHFY